MAIGKEIQIIPLSWQGLMVVPLEQKALYICLSFLVSELNCLQRLVLLATQAESTDPVHHAFATIQSNALARMYSSKCFEAQAFVKSAHEKTRDDSVKDLAQRFLSIIDLLNFGKGFSIAEHIRRKMTFHLDFGQVVKVTRSAKDIVDCNLYTADIDGNCLFPIGDQVVFHEGLTGAAEEAKHSLISDEDYQAWVKWSVSVNSTIKDMHFEAYTLFVQPILFKEGAQPKTILMDDRAIAISGRDQLPLFIGDGL